MKPKLLITGASGFLGYHLLAKAVSEYDCIALGHQRLPEKDGVKALKADLCNYRELGDLIEELQPDMLIHAAAMADTAQCEKNQEASYALNVEATLNLGGICADLRIPMVFTSTDLVFDGKKGNYTETDTVNPLNRYGEHKAMAEEQLLRVYPEALIGRLSMMFGERAAGEHNYLQQLLRQLEQGLRPKLFFDEFRSICGAYEAARALLYFAGKQSGLLHLAGPERLSRYEFGLRVCRSFGFDESLLEPCSSDEVNTGSKRPKDVSLDVSKAAAAGFVAQKTDWSLNELIKP